MKKIGLLTVILLITIVAFVINFRNNSSQGAPPYQIEDLNPPNQGEYSWLNNWKRPDGPAKVGLQVGHWKNEELPDELDRLRGNSGSSGGGKNEWEVNLTIANMTKELLEEKDIVVEIFPATIPQDYWADVFVAIHADGSTDKSKSGFKIAKPRRDFSGKADILVGLIQDEYALATNLEIDPNITRNMTGYYAFSWWRYSYAVHPKTASGILETGFLTNPHDRQIIVKKPELAAKGIARGIILFLESENLLPKQN